MAPAEILRCELSRSMATPKQQQRNVDPSTPLSPALNSRRDEKAQMINLNNRLALYVEKVRSLESENSRLHVQISSYEHSSITEVNNMKAIYEGELSEARRLLDELSKEKAQLQIEASSFKDKATSEKNRANDLEHDNTVLEGKLKDLHSRLNHKENQVSIAVKERDALKEELDNLKSKVSDLQNELENTQRMLECETLQRVDFENKLQSVREELLFKDRLYQEEITEVRKRHTVSLTEIDSQAQGDYENKLESALFDLREQQSLDLEQMREDLEAQYALKIERLTKSLDMVRKSHVKSGEGSKSYELKIDRLQTTIKSLQVQVSEAENKNITILQELLKENNSLSNKIQEFEGQLETERELRITSVMSIEKERDSVREQLAIMEKEYGDLLDLKIKLDHEIGVYRKLLEEEEHRLNLSPSPMVDGSGSTTRSRARRKRKRVTVEKVESKSRRHVEMSASESGVVVEEREQTVKVPARQDGDNSCAIM